MKKILTIIILLLVSPAYATEGIFGPIKFKYPEGWKLEESDTYEGFNILSPEIYNLGPVKMSNVFTVKRFPSGGIPFEQFRKQITSMNQSNIENLKAILKLERNRFPQFKNIEIDQIFKLEVNDYRFEKSFYTIADNVTAIHNFATQWHTESIFIEFGGFIYTASFSYPPSQKKEMAELGKEFFTNLKILKTQ